MVFAALQQLCIYIITWNVGTKSPDSLLLNELLGFNGIDAACDQFASPDVYVIGLQEVSSKPQNQLLGLFQPDPWTTKLKETLRTSDFVAVKTEQMQGALIILFVKRQHLIHLRNIESEFTRTGFGGIWGNKGGVSIRMTLYGCAITFVNSHLAAHDHELNERINDYNQILKKHQYHVNGYRDIFSHDYVFWLGDLNFRLQYENEAGGTTSDQVIDMVEQNDWKKLLERDQLKLVRSTSRAFHQLEENLPNFPPTFKFFTESSRYDPKRRPAWTDRILWQVHKDVYSNVALEAEQLSYKSHPNYTLSDHKPVTSEFKIKVFESPASEKFVEFVPIQSWNIGGENNIEYVFPFDFEENTSDWIGIYRSTYSSLSEFLAYEYTTQSNRKKIDTNQNEIHKTLKLSFSQSFGFVDGEQYVLIYVSNTGAKGITSICGISNTFKAERSPTNLSID